MRLRDGSEAESKTPTAYAVHCSGDPYPACDNGGIIYLTEACYNAQMRLPDSRWSCPRCGGLADWDDDVYEDYLDSHPKEDKER